MTYLVISSAKKTQAIHVRDGKASYSPPSFNEWARDDFKVAVPWQARKWEKALATWSCDVAYLDALKTFASAFGPVEVEEES